MTELERLLSGPVVTAAQGLLGRRLESRSGGKVVAVVITELEAYGGADDPASHAHRGPTARNRSMFGPPGTLYVYRSYGIHWCMNVVIGPEGVASAVLLRGGKPVEGEATMVERRGRSDVLARGPGRLTQALGVSGDLDGSSVFDGPVSIVGVPQPDLTWTATPRIGISRATDRPWRFLLSGS
ncbi:MAG: DNA-3-methyladenine glycosylase [Acidimicrobiia bacterium]